MKYIIMQISFFYCNRDRKRFDCHHKIPHQDYFYFSFYTAVKILAHGERTIKTNKLEINSYSYIGCQHSDFTAYSTISSSFYRLSIKCETDNPKSHAKLFLQRLIFLPVILPTRIFLFKSHFWMYYKRSSVSEVNL